MTAVIVAGLALYVVAVLSLCRAAANGDRLLHDDWDDDRDRATGGGW